MWLFSRVHCKAYVEIKLMIVVGEPPETFIHWAVAENLRDAKLSSEPLFDWYNCKIENLGGLERCKATPSKIRLRM